MQVYRADPPAPPLPASLGALLRRDRDEHGKPLYLDTGERPTWRPRLLSGAVGRPHQMGQINLPSGSVVKAHEESVVGKSPRLDDSVQHDYSPLNVAAGSTRSVRRAGHHAAKSAAPMSTVATTA